MPFLAPLIASITASAGALATTAGGGIFASFLTFMKGGSILASIIKIGFSMAAQYALGALFAPKPTAQASQLEVTYGDSVPRVVVLGRVGFSGHHVFRNARGKGNRNIDDVYRLSDFRISDIPRVKAQGYWRTVSGTSSAISGLKGPASIKKYYGTMDQVADAALVSRSGGRWKNTAHGKGIAYAIIVSDLDIEGLTTPVQPIFEVIGPKLYDWRKDTSVGGDGDDRWNDQDSWSGDPENPVLQMYLLERGVYNGSELILGKGVPASRLPLAEWTIAANICDEPIGAGVRYRSSLIAGAGEGITHDSNMQPLLEACAASWVEDASGEYPIVGAVQATVATFTDDDLVVGESYRYSEYRPRLQLVNTVSGSFIDPNSFYDKAPLVTRIDAGALAVDGERLAVSLPFKAVTYSDQADRLADIQIRASRYQANAEICLRPKFLAIKPGRWVRWNSARHGDKTFLVISKRLGEIGTNGTRLVYLTLQQIGVGVFDPTAYETVPVSPLPPGTPDYASEVDNILVQPWTLTSEATGLLPAIRVSFDEILDTTIAAVDFEYWPTAQPGEVQYDTLQMPATVKFLSVGVISNTEYQVRYKLRAVPARSIPWVGPYSVTTPEASDTDITVKFANLSAAVRGSLQYSLAQLALVQSKLAQLALATADGTMQATDTRNIAVRFQNATASAINVLNASITDIDGVLTAQAEALTAINATLGTNSSGALFRMFASAGEGDVVARIDLQVRATLSDSDWVTAGTIWEVVDDDGDLYGRIILTAAKTMIMDDEGNILALFEADGVTIANARIRDLEAVNIKARSVTGDRVVQYGIDTYELQLDSVTYVDSANTSTPTSIDTGVPTSIRQTVMVDDYVSGGVVGTVTVNVDLVAAFGTNNHQLLVVRDSVPTFDSSPTVVAGNVLQVDATMSGTWYWGTGFSDIPPGPGDWYYCIKVGATFGSSNSLNSQSIGIIHAKR